MRKFVLSFCLLFAVQSFACLNQYRENLQGEGTEWGSLRVFYRSFHTEYSQAFVDLYDLEKKEDYSYEEMSDVSVHLARLGEYEASLDLLKWLYHQHPDEYQIVANLGTLYELNGMNDSAHFFIAKGMELNPDSHHGSEWFHLKILEAKMQIAKDSTWLDHHQVLGLGLDYAMDEGDAIHWHTDDTIHHITHQLAERIPFTPTPDLILANVFGELGDMLAVNFSIEDAYYAYKIGKYYGPDNAFDNARKAEDMKVLMKDIETYDDFEYYFPPKGEYREEGDVEDLKKGTTSSDEIEQDEMDDVTESDTEIQGQVIGAIVGGIGLFVLVFIYIRYRRKGENSEPLN